MSDFWVVCCYFNAAGFRLPVRNYHLFRQRLRDQGVPLLTVELAFGNRPFVLERQANDPWHVRLSGQSILWQKERLLNHAIGLLPASCTKVAWVDADILWADASWSEQASQLLDRYTVIQLFSGARRLFPQQTDWVDSNPYGQPLWLEEGVLAKWQKGEDNGCIGFAWAARREFLVRHGLYDRCILGGGDYVFFNALVGRDKPWGHPPLDRDVRAWQQKIVEDKISFSYLDCEVRHLYHGNLSKRRYQDRHRILIDYDYHPRRDVYQLDQVLEWATIKPCLHQQVADYFVGREEDAPWVNET